MAALYDGNGDRIFRLDYRKTASYISNKAGTAENVYYPTSSVNSSYDADVIMDEMLIPNGVTANTAINYELTGYINDINTEYTQTLMEFGASGNTTNIYEYGESREIATINGTKYSYMYDGRGSVASLTGSAGSNIASYTYNAYGEETKSTSTINNPYRYNAEYTDSSPCFKLGGFIFTEAFLFSPGRTGDFSSFAIQKIKALGVSSAFFVKNFIIFSRFG